MSISLLLNNAVTALQTNQSALAVTSSNIANLNTQDYARREVHLAAAQAGDTLMGVEIAEVRRIVNQFLSREALTTNAGAQFYGTKQQFHDRLQSMIGKPDDERSLAGRLTTLMAQFNEVSVDPASLPRRADLLADLDQLASTLSGLAMDLQQLRSDANQQLNEKVKQVNQLTSEIFDLGFKIQSSVLAEADPSALEDRRDTALNQLSELLDITVNYESNGRVNVSTTSGLSLVGTLRYELQYNTAGLATAQTVFSQVTLHRVNAADGTLDPAGTDFNRHMQGGELGALVQLRDFDMVETAKSLGALAATVTDAINGVHNDNVSLPPPNVLTGINTGLLAGDAHGFTGKTTLSVVSDQGALVRRIDLDFTGGTYSVNGGAAVAFSGGTIANIVADINGALGADGSISFVNGVMTLSATAATNGVGFLQDTVDPSLRAGRGFSHSFGLNNLMGAKTRSHFETGLTVGSAHGLVGGPANFELKSSAGEVLQSISIMPAGVTVGDVMTQLNNAATGFGAYGLFSLDANGQMIFTPSAGYDDAVIVSKGDATSRGTTAMSMSELFGLGERFQMQQADQVFVEPRILQDQRYLALAKLDLNPATIVGSIVVSPSDGRGAIEFSDIQGKTFSVPAAGNLVATNVTLGEYVSNFLADTGQRAAQVEISASNSRSLNAEVKSRLANERGVSLDEELANMMVYQQSYNAAARMVTTAKEVYDALLRMA